MKPLFTFLILLIIYRTANAQPFIFENPANSAVFYLEKTKAEALKYRLKEVYAYEKKSKKNDSTLVFFEKYDSLGNILDRVNHHYKKRKDFEHTFFLYDSIGNLKEQYSIISFSKNYIHNYRNFYYKNSKIESIEIGSGFVDKINFRKYNIDTNKIDSSSFCTYDSVGRILKIESKDYRLYEEYFYNNEGLFLIKFVDTNNYIQNFYYNSKNEMIEEINYEGIDKFWGRYKYEYYPNGLIKTSKKLNKRGREIERKVYYYNTFK